MISGIGESGEMPIGEMYRGENSGGTQVAENKARNTWKVVIDSFMCLFLVVFSSFVLPFKPVLVRPLNNDTV